MAFTAVNAMSFTGKHAGNGGLIVSFENYVGDRLLQFDTVLYKNEAGQSFTITKFKYYIGNIRLKKAGGGAITYNDYYLVNEEEPASKKISLDNVPAGEYTGIEFIIGVDSLHNCSGAQSGALDPVNAMFWAWNTGYIFLKLEGKSSASKSPGNIFEFHIGGYRQPYNCIRKVSLNFTQPVTISPAASKELHIKTDVAELFKTPVSIDLSKLSSVTDFHNSTTIADNYMDMFSVLSIK
jgi:hypothetical protein